MNQDNASRGKQTSAPKNIVSSKYTQSAITLPQSRSDWSLVLSTLPDNWVLTPVKDKRPLRPNWQEEAAISRCDLMELLVTGQKLKTSKGALWHCRWTGIGLRLGTLSGGVLAIDADGDLAEAKLQELSGGDLPLTPCWTSGKPGRRQLLYRISPEYWEKIKTVKIDCGQGQHLEFRWDGCQSVLPPSKHPETGQYYWLVSPEESAQENAQRGLTEQSIERNAQNQEIIEKNAQNQEIIGKNAQNQEIIEKNAQNQESIGKNAEDVSTAIAPRWLIEFLLQNQAVYSQSPSLKLPYTAQEKGTVSLSVHGLQTVQGEVNNNQNTSNPGNGLQGDVNNKSSVNGYKTRFESQTVEKTVGSEPSLNTHPHNDNGSQPKNSGTVEDSSSVNAPHQPVNELQGQPTLPNDAKPIYPHLYPSKGAYRPSQQWTDEDWARSYLEALAPWRTDDYDQWVQVGMALQSVSDGLLSDWEHWSRQSSKYKPGDCERKWRSFKPTKGISIGSLALWAKEDGWQSPFKSQISSSVSNSPNTVPKEIVPPSSNSPPNKLSQSVSNTFSHHPNSSNNQPIATTKVEDNMNEQQEVMNSDQQVTLKEAVTHLIMQGISGSDRQEALFYLSCQYHIPSQQLDRYWQELAQEIDVEQIKPEIITQVENLLQSRNYRLDPQQIFPQEFAQLMNNCAEAMPGPVEGLIVTLLSAAASCVGTGAEVVVKQRSGYSQPCLIRTLLLGETGEMKSPLQKIILAPLKQLEKEALKQYQQELEDYQAAIEQGEKNLKRPQRERFLLIDCTPEEQIRIHAKSPRGFLVHHDEWGAYLKGFNKYRNGQGNDREIDLSEFNGDMYIRDRVNDDSIFLEKMAISRSGGYQLSLMYDLIEQQEDLDGFLSRWLISAPPFPPAYKNFVDDEGNDVEVFQDLLYSLYRGLSKLPSSRYFLTLEARENFQHWQHHLVDLMNAETHLSLKGVYPKLEAYTVRLALVLHLVEAVILGQVPETTISGETMKRAIYLAQYFLIQTQWVYCRKNSETEGLSGFMAEIQQWASKKGVAIAARQIKNGISCINKCKKATADFIRKLFTQLADAGYGMLHGKGIHLRYEAKSCPSPAHSTINSVSMNGASSHSRSTNQQFESPPPLIPDQPRGFGQTKNVDPPYQQKSTSTKATSTKSSLSSKETTTVREIGIEEGTQQEALSRKNNLMSVLPSAKQEIQTPTNSGHCTDDGVLNPMAYESGSAEFSFVREQPPAECRRLSASEQMADKPSKPNVPVRVEISPNLWVGGVGHENETGDICVELENKIMLIVPRSACHFVDVDKNVAPPINSVKVTQQEESSQNVDLLIDPWLVDELPSDIPWETFPEGALNGKSGRQLAQEIQKTLLSYPDLSQLSHVIQVESFTESMVIWVIEHLIEPAKRQLFFSFTFPTF